ncbi:MAG: OB-fold domain-containing protein [Acidimicrobiales bacterium]|nr:OB-fold domain-containing protein [Acidimicrobiales bacterium]MDG1845233.1 OB-fold domain-containing protein [Acidimicrobiales bacterium]
METHERLSAPLVLEYPFTRTTGPVIGAFLTGLREAILLGIKRADGTVLFPPTEYDPQSSESLYEMVEVGQDGTVLTWTWIDKPRDQSPWKQAHALALIQLDQTDTSLLHAVLVDDVKQMITGMRVTTQWRDEREGHINDIEGFIPIEGSGV